MRGGKREGSGRPKTDNKQRNIRLTDKEYESVKEFIAFLRCAPYDFGGTKVKIESINGIKIKSD